MNMGVYFKDPQGVLHKLQDQSSCCTSVGSDDIPEAINTVKDMLATTKQAYVGQTVLTVVEGSKA